MHGSARRPSATTRAARGLLLGAVGLLGTATATARAAGPTPPSSSAAIQAWVFDGSYQPGDAFGVALTDSGMVTFVTNPLECPDPGAVSETGFLSLSPPHVGVYQVLGSLGFGPAFDPAVLFPLPPAPIDPALVTNDCVALAHEAGVQGYVSSQISQVDALAAQLAACVQDVHETGCAVLAAAETAAAICQSDPDRCVALAALECPTPPGSDDSGMQGPMPGASCLECRLAMEELPFRVSVAQFILARCQYALAPLQIHLGRLQAFNSGQLHGHPGGCFPDEVLWLVDRAEQARQEMDEIVSAAQTLASSCSHQSLFESCELCPDNPGDPPVQRLSGAVSVRRSARHLGRLAGVLQSEASTTAAPALAERYREIAGRLGSLPDDRVLEVSSPTPAPFSQQVVALRPASAPDDGHSPLAVVLAFVRSRAGQRPRLNQADRELLQQSFEAFKNTLAPRR